MAGRRSLLSLVLLVDLLVLAWFAPTFVQGPAPRTSGFLAPSAALAAATLLPVGAQAVEKWQYKEPTGELQPEQYLIFFVFFLAHAAGVADFYSKKTGGGPAVPINIFRSEQFWDPKGTVNKGKPLFGFYGSFLGDKK